MREGDKDGLKHFMESGMKCVLSLLLKISQSTVFSSYNDDTGTLHFYRQSPGLHDLHGEYPRLLGGLLASETGPLPMLNEETNAGRR